jgi:hypothetical protein
MDHFGSLFKVLLIYIFKKVASGRELSNLSQVNKRFKEILINKEIWKIVVERDLSENHIEALKFLEDENLFENVYKSFSNSTKLIQQNPKILNLKKHSYFTDIQVDFEARVMKNKFEEEIYLMDCKKSKRFETSFFAGYLDVNNKITKRF